MLSTSIYFSFTITLHLTSFCSALAIISTSPAFFAVTFPLASTVAILSLLLVHVTALLVALLGFTFAVKLYVSPSFSSILCLSNFILSTLICFSFTITLHLASFSSALAIISASPTFFAVTFPFP